MKKLFFLWMSTGCFMLLSSTTVLGQLVISNQTDCSFNVKFKYGNASTCSSSGTIEVTVPPDSIMPVNVPSGDVIIDAKGSYTNGECDQFRIGEACSGHSKTDAVSCSASCGAYEARLSTKRGIVILKQ